MNGKRVDDSTTSFPLFFQMAYEDGAILPAKQQGKDEFLEHEWKEVKCVGLTSLGQFVVLIGRPLFKRS